MTMQFNHVGQPITLNGLSPTGLTMEEGPQFLKAFTSGNKGLLLHLIFPQIEGSNQPLSGAIHNLLTEFDQLFAEPKGFPPI